MGLSIYIGGMDRTGLVLQKQLGIVDELNTRNTYSFTLASQGGLYRPVVGQNVSVYKDSVAIFAGTIESIDEYAVTNGAIPVVSFACSCIDYNQVCDRFLAAEAYENMTAGGIVRNLVDGYINAFSPGEGILKDYIEDGPLVTKAVFNYVPVTQALDELSEITGYVWYIDYERKMHFHSRLSMQAPFNLNNTSNNFRNMRIQHTRSDYRNKQYFRGGQDISAVRSESFKGDGETSTFVLQLPVAKTPGSVNINGVTKSVGIRNVESGKDWYWSKGEREITQDSLGIKLTSDDILSVSYQGLFPIIVENYLDSAILERKELEGGTGIYEHVASDTNVDTSMAAQERSEALLRKYGNIAQSLEFETDNDGLKAGQLIEINLPGHNIDSTYLIQRVSISDVTSSRLRYSVKVLSGENMGGWVDFFKKLAKSGQTYVIRENEVLLKIRKLKENIRLTDVLSLDAKNPAAMVDISMVAFGEVG